MFQTRGRLPTLEELSDSDNTCPICHDLFSDPVKLSCKVRQKSSSVSAKVRQKVVPSLLQGTS